MILAALKYAQEEVLWYFLHVNEVRHSHFSVRQTANLRKRHSAQHSRTKRVTVPTRLPRSNRCSQETRIWRVGSGAHAVHDWILWCKITHATRNRIFAVCFGPNWDFLSLVSCTTLGPYAKFQNIRSLPYCPKTVSQSSKQVGHIIRSRISSMYTTSHSFRCRCPVMSKSISSSTDYSMQVPCSQTTDCFGTHK